MTIPFRPIPNVPVSNTALDISKGAAGFIEGLLQARRQKQQDALTEALQSSLMLQRQNQAQHLQNLDETSAQRLTLEEQNKAELAKQAKFKQLQDMFPDVAGPMEGLDNIIAQQEFSPLYSQAVQKARSGSVHSPVPFEFRGSTYTYTPKEFNPAQMVGIGQREDQYDINLTKDWYKLPENKLVGQYGANYARGLATLQQALNTDNPTAYKSAILQFVNLADPTGRQALGLIKYMSDIDPSLIGRFQIFKQKLTTGTLPKEEVQNMIEHLKSVMSAVAQDYDARREAWINSYPGHSQENIRTSQQLFPMLDQLIKTNPQQPVGHGAASPKRSLDQIYSGQP